MKLPIRSLALYALCGAAFAANAQTSAPAAPSQPPAQPPAAQPAAQEKTPDGKIIVPGVDDIPKHFYVIKKKPSELFNSREDILALAREVKTNLEGDLAKYEIKDAHNRMSVYGVLATIATVEGDLETAQRYYDIMRDLDDNPGTKPLTGQYMMSAATTAKQANGDAAKHAELFEADIKRRLNALPWKAIKPELEKIQSRAAILSMDYISRTLVGGFDPYFDLDGGKVDTNVVYGLLGMRASADNMVPVVHKVPKVIEELITQNTIIYPDVWTPNQINFGAKDTLNPVVIGVWNGGGIDADSLAGSLWTNPSEQPNNLDDDNNGFVDDIHGIAFGIDSYPQKDLLLPLLEMRCEPTLLETYYLGAFEYSAALRTTPAVEFAQTVRWIGSEQQKPMLEDFRLLREHRLGTFAASLAIQGNPAAKVVGVRMSIEHLDVSRVTYKDEWVNRRCKSIQDSVKYLKAAGARVVVIQNVLSKSSLESALQTVGAKNPKERTARIDTIFNTMSNALKQAFQSAPEILFVCSAPFSEAPADWTGFLPAAMNEPNLLVVGAMKNSAEPCIFTTKLDPVWCFVSATDLSGTAADNKTITTSGPTHTAAVAANAAAKVLAVRPELTAAQLIEAIRKNATPCPELPGKFMMNPKQTVESLRAH
ncbi:MAG: S8 family serine peptidase [Phycisphaerales bacterium]